MKAAVLGRSAMLNQLSKEMAETIGDHIIWVGTLLLLVKLL